MKIYTAKYYNNNKAKCLELRRKWREAHPGYFRDYEKNATPEMKVRRKAMALAWRERNRDRLRAQRRAAYRRNGGYQWYRKLRTSDPLYNLKTKLRGRINAALRSMKNGRGNRERTIPLLGCSYSAFKMHIESQFREGMTWEAVCDGRIHLDHRFPIAAFDITKPKEQRRCFHFTNIQPLWAKDNLAKGARVASISRQMNSVLEFRDAFEPLHQTSLDLLPTGTF